MSKPGLCPHRDGYSPHLCLFMVWTFTHKPRKYRHTVHTETNNKALISFVQNTHTHTHCPEAKLNEAGCPSEADRRVSLCSHAGQNSSGQPQYSTVTALVLRYSMRASSPVDETENTTLGYWRKDEVVKGEIVSSFEKCAHWPQAIAMCRRELSTVQIMITFSETMNIIRCSMKRSMKMLQQIMPFFLVTLLLCCFILHVILKRYTNACTNFPYQSLNSLYSPRSLPKPDCLKPPKGDATSVLL